MTRLTLPVGQNERHNVEVFASTFKGTQVHLDGKPISTFDVPGRTKMVKFSIGEKERHDIEVRVHGLFLHKIDVLVDGKFSCQG